MLWVSLISFCVTAAVVLEVVFRRSDFFSPARLYLFFHSVTLGVAFLGFHHAMTPFKPFTSLVYFGSGACFVLGAILPHLLVGRGPKALAPSFANYNWRVHWLMSFALFAVFLSGMWVARMGSGAFPLFAKKTVAAIEAFNNVHLYSNATYNMGAIAAAMFFTTAVRPTRLPFILRPGLWMAVATLAIFSLSMNRSGSLLAIFFSLAMFNYGIRRLSLPKLAMLLVVLLGMFLPFTYLKVSDEERKLMARVDFVEASGILMKVPYLYIANNYWDLDYALNPENYEVRHPTSYGFTTFSGILDLMALPGGNLGWELRDAGGYENMFHGQTIKVKGLNTIPYQWGLYKDFGLAGVLLVPLFVGILIGSFYRRLREQPDMFNVSVYSYLAFFIAFNWFTAMWELVNFAYGFLYVAGSCYLARKLTAGPSGAPAAAERALRNP